MAPAQWEILWELSKGLLQAPQSPAFASTLADLQDASGFLRFMEETCDLREEQILGAIIGLLYTTELFSTSPEARYDCVRQLPGSGVDESQLDCLVAFGEHLLRYGFQKNTGRGERDSMTGEIEEAWCDFCSSRGVEVKTEEERYPLLEPEDETTFFSSPFRTQQGNNNSSKVIEATSSSSKPPSLDPPKLMGFSCESVPKFFEIAHRLLHSAFFLSLPLENLGHNYRRFCKETLNPDAWVKAYSPMAHTTPVLPVDLNRAPAEDGFPVLRSQLRKLLEGVRSHGRGSLLRALLTQRPPASMLPHLHAVVDCTVHARLWLSGIDLTIYMESELTYAELGNGSFAEKEQRVYSSIFIHERVPSCVELLQRFCCHSHICGSVGKDAEVLVLSAKDYNTLGAPNDEMWRALRKHIRYSMYYTEGMKVTPYFVLGDLASIYRPLLNVDRKWAKLHPYLGGDRLRIPPVDLSLPDVVFRRYDAPPIPQRLTAAHPTRLTTLHPTRRLLLLAACCIPCIGRVSYRFPGKLDSRLRLSPFSLQSKY